MSFLYDQEKIRQQKLERFRESFLIVTQDGQYPPERQLRLYQATIQAGLDWNEARRFIRLEATAFFQRYLTTLLAQGALTTESVAELNRLRRRLALDESVTGNLVPSQSVPTDKHQPTSTPAIPLSTRVSRFWSAFKLISAIIVTVPVIWFGLSFLTSFLLYLLVLFTGADFLAWFLPVASIFNFFLAIFFTVWLVRRQRRRTTARPMALQQPRSVSDNLPSSPAPLPLAQYAPAFRATPHLMVTGQSLFASVRQLSGKEFEHWVGDRLTEMGWQQVRVMGGRADRGVDIRGVYQGKRCIVQCKHYPGRVVPPNEVRALVGTRNIQRAQRAYLITSGQFGYQCFHEVYRKPVELWDLETLATHLNNSYVSAA